MEEEKLQKPEDSEKGENLGEGFDTLQTPPTKAKGRGDIVFVVDVTSSMTPCIEGLKNSLHSFFEGLERQEIEGIPVPSWRMRIVTFKDLDCATDSEPKLDNSKPFVETREEFEQQINSLQIEKYQGCDEPESVLEAIYVAARKSDWRPALGEERVHRVIVALTDAPPKDKFNASVLTEEDKGAFPNIENGYVNDINSVVEFLYNLLAEEHIKLFLYAPEHETYKKLADYGYKSYYVSVGSPQDKSRYEGLKNINYENLYTVLLKTISGQ